MPSLVVSRATGGPGRVWSIGESVHVGASPPGAQVQTGRTRQVVGSSFLNK